MKNPKPYQNSLKTSACRTKTMGLRIPPRAYIYHSICYYLIKILKVLPVAFLINHQPLTIKNKKSMLTLIQNIRNHCLGFTVKEIFKVVKLFHKAARVNEQLFLPKHRIINSLLNEVKNCPDFCRSLILFTKHIIS